MIELFVVTDVCENPNILSSIAIISKIVTILYYLVPILLIVMLVLDLGKNVVTTGNEIGKNTSMIVKRVISAMIFFMIPSTINFTLDLVVLDNEDLSKNWESCLDNSKNIAIYKRKYQLLKEKDDAEFEARRSQYIFTISQKQANAHVIKPPPEPSAEYEGGVFNGQTYQLDDETIRKLAALGMREQGNDPAGVAAEVSLMANLYELRGRQYGSILGYVMNGGWFSRLSSAFALNPGPELIAAARDVLVNGNRTLPLYVDEHDCIDCGSYGFDIVSIEVNGQVLTGASQLLDRSNYIRGQTILHNKYGSTYTFWCFPTPYSDPFGYTPMAYNAIMGGR